MSTSRKRKSKHTHRKAPKATVRKSAESRAKAHYLMLLLSRDGFVPVIHDEGGCVLYRPEHKIGPSETLTEMASNTRMLDIDYSPLNIWELEVPEELQETYNEEWDEVWPRYSMQCSRLIEYTHANGLNPLS